MKQSTLEYIEQKQKFPRDFYDYGDYILLGIPMMLGVTAFSLIESDFDFFPIAGLSFILGIFLFIIIYRRINENWKFQKINTHTQINLTEVADQVRDCFKLNDIQIDSRKCVIVADTKLSPFSWGEQITIIVRNTFVLVNSRPRTAMQSVTVVRDKNNLKKIKTLITELDSAAIVPTVQECDATKV